MKEIVAVGILAILVLNCAGAKDDYKRNMANGRKAEVIILGCVHQRHKDHKYFRTAVLKNILVKLDADIILIEEPIEFFVDGKPVPGEEEAIMRSGSAEELREAWKLCKSGKAKCLPFDIKGRDDYYIDEKYNEKQEKFFQALEKTVKIERPNIYDALDRASSLEVECANSFPETINSILCDEIAKQKITYIGKEVKYAMKEMGLQEVEFAKMFKAFWQKRNQEMEKNICKIVEENIGRRIVVTVGWNHRYILKELIKNNCPKAEMREYWELL